MFFVFVIFSQFDWICCDGTEGVCVYVCMCVCMCVCRLCASVCGSAHAQTDKLILIQFCKNDLTNICEVCFSQILKLRNRWRHGGHFSHGRNLCPIYFKIGHDVELLHPLFAIWNQQNQSVTSGFMKSRAPFMISEGQEFNPYLGNFFRFFVGGLIRLIRTCW